MEWGYLVEESRGKIWTILIAQSIKYIFLKKNKLTEELDCFPVAMEGWPPSSRKWWLWKRRRSSWASPSF